MLGWTRRLERFARVHTFDYPYMAAGRRRPDRLPTLLDAHREALGELRARCRARGPLVLAGKSMGSRVGCHLALEAEVDRLVCFGYPLVGASKSRPVRDEVLRQLEVPILFVQGTRDRLCPLDHLDRVRGQMRAETALHVVEAGDHSLQVTKRWLREHDTTQSAVDEQIAEVVRRFILS